jgi:D-aminopeptidase
VGNGYGKIVGTTQVSELGVIETPVVLTATMCTFRAADALVSYMLSLPGNENLQSVNPVVAETNDGFLSDIRRRPVTEEHVLAALRGAASGPVAEGAVGAGTGTRALGFKAPGAHWPAWPAPALTSPATAATTRWFSPPRRPPGHCRIPPLTRCS